MALSTFEHVPDSLRVNDEQAYEYIADLANKKVHELQGLTIYRGIHPTLGTVSIVVPALGDSIILRPF